MPPSKRFILIALTLVACVGCDQRTKSMAARHLQGREAQSFFGDIARFDYTENTGGFLGLGDSLPEQWRTALFLYGCAAGLAALLAYTCFSRRLSAMQILAMAMICAGGIGNLLDRWILGGHVRDFLNVGLGGFRTGIFNVADATMMAGCVLIVIQNEPWRRHRSSPL